MQIVFSMFHHNHRNSKSKIGTRLVGYCFDRLDHVLWRIVEGLCNGGVEKTLGVERLVGCSVEAWKIRLRAVQMIET